MVPLSDQACKRERTPADSAYPSSGQSGIKDSEALQAQATRRRGALFLRQRQNSKKVSEARTVPWDRRQFDAREDRGSRTP